MKVDAIKDAPKLCQVPQPHKNNLLKRVPFQSLFQALMFFCLED